LKNLRAATVEINLQRRLLGAGERAGEVARAMEKIVDAARKRRIVRVRRSDLGAYFADMSHVSTIRASQVSPMYLGGRSRWWLPPGLEANWRP
jgi:hypothetical protein